MKIILLVLTPLIALTLLAGCSNAVTYHHSERNSIALETRATDPQQPVQGTIGIKTRTIVVTPKVDKSSGKSTNVVSDFELKRKPNESWYKFGTTEISSTFMTGQAAKDASTRSILAVKGGVGSGALGPLNVHKKMILQNMYYTLDELTEDKNAVKLKTRLDNLHKLLPDVSKITFYHLTKGNLKGFQGSQVKSISADFDGVMNYLELVDNSLYALDHMQDNRSVTYMSKDIDGKQLNLLKQARQTLVKERETFNETIGNSQSIDDTIIFITDIL